MTQPSSSNKPGEDEGSLPPLPQGASPISEATSEQPGKNPAAVQLGHLGGIKGGPARARKLTKQQRADIARKAAQTRWAKRRGR
jgi:hypothetical protein